MAGRLSPFSYADGVRQTNHPLLVVPPELAKLLDQKFLEKHLINPPKLTGIKCKAFIMSCVKKLESAADAAAAEEKYELYHSLTYLSDAFIPILLLAEDRKHLVIAKDQIREFWPCIDRVVMHEGQLPALLHLVLQCCYWSDSVKKAVPIIHMLTKGIPKRCQVRSFIDIINKMQQADKSIMNFILDVFNCFALGGYRHSKQRPVFEVRSCLYKNLIFSSGAKDHMHKWFMDHYFTDVMIKGVPKKKKVYRHANIMTLAVREYLCTCIRLIPGLHDVLVERCNWSSFEEDVFQTADSARRLMNDNFTINRYWFADMDAAVNSKKSGKDSNIYQPIKNAFIPTLITQMNTVETSYMCDFEADKQPTYLHEQLDDCVKRLICKTLTFYRGKQLLVTEEIPRSAAESEQFIEQGKFPLCCFGCSVQSARQIRIAQQEYYREERAKIIYQLVHQLWEGCENMADFALCSFLFRRLHLNMNVTLQLLPAHYLLYQYMAIVCRKGLPLDTSIQHVAERHGKICVCMQCKTVHSFVVTPESNAKSSTFYAHGNSRVIIDHDTGYIYCTGKKRDGKGSNPASYKTLQSIAKGDNFNPLDAEKAVKKERKRQLKKQGERKQSNLCRDTRITEYNILGRVLHFFDKSYILCCYCGRLTEFSGRRYHHDAFVCGCCTEQKKQVLPITCSLCKRTERTKGSFATYRDVISDIGGGGGERITIHLCNTHNKPWIASEYSRHESEPLSMSRIVQGNQERWTTANTSAGTITISRPNNIK